MWPVVFTITLMAIGTESRLKPTLVVLYFIEGIAQITQSEAGRENKDLDKIRKKQWQSTAGSPAVSGAGNTIPPGCVVCPLWVEEGSNDVLA
jgi:hypothetical protein